MTMHRTDKASDHTYTVADTIIGIELTGVTFDGLTNALQALFSDAPAETYRLCADLARAISNHEPTDELEAYLGVHITQESE